MPEFELIVPDDLAGVLDALGRYGADVTLLAGGTDLGVVLRSGTRTPRVVVSLGKVRELNYVCCGAGSDQGNGGSGQRGSRGSGGGDGVGGGGRRALGPMVTHSEIAAHPLLRDLRALTKGAASIGSPQVRNAGTAGGNLANASPAADLCPPLLVLDAEVSLASAGSERTVALEDFLKGPGLTAIQPNEIIRKITLSAPAAGADGNRDGNPVGGAGEGEAGARFFCDFAKVGLRNAMAISVASAAIAATGASGATGGEGRFEDIKIACGAVASRPLRMRGVEALVRGQALTADLVREVEAVAAKECDPITDIRASADYRRRVAGVLVSRLVEAAWDGLCSRRQSQW
jgi:CO/xanthine dehydrogenase FAD-binding subunit